MVKGFSFPFSPRFFFDLRETSYEGHRFVNFPHFSVYNTFPESQISIHESFTSLEETVDCNPQQQPILDRRSELIVITRE